MPDAELDDYRWLASEGAESWLRRAESHSGELTVLVRLLRSDLTAGRAHLVVEQVELRRRAREKFARPEQMLFTRRALEQATGEAPARHKASRFPAGAATLDLCCGIGGDLMALAARGPVAGIDRDPVMALLAAHNCRVLGLGAIQVEPIDVEEVAVGERAAWHIDPDRRAQGRRTTRVEQYEPGIETVERLLQVCGSAAIKLAPAALAPEQWANVAELEWIGEQGECKQQVAWFGDLARHVGQRCATALLPDKPPRIVVGDSADPLPEASEVGRYVFEPHAVVLAARLATALAAEYGLAAIADLGGYLTGDLPILDDALAPFEVQEVLPFDLRRLKGWLRERSVGRLEIKVRGLKESPEQLRRQLHVPGEEAAVLLLTRFRGVVRAILARRLKESRNNLT